MTQTVAAIPHRVTLIHPDIDPARFWLAVDEWIASFGGVDNSTWEEVAPFYQARTSAAHAALAVMQGRLVSP